MDFKKLPLVWMMVLFPLFIGSLLVSCQAAPPLETKAPTLTSPALSPTAASSAAALLTPTPFPSLHDSPDGHFPILSRISYQPEADGSAAPVVQRYFQAGSVEVPILLYHHVAEKKIGPDQQYYVSPKQFALQMSWLKEAGYTPITVSQMAEVLKNGGFLPEKTVVITFDDANLDVYQEAYPVMKSLNFPGTVYVVWNALSSPYHISTAVLKDMQGQGWEIGSHSLSHVNLKNTDKAEAEICKSKVELEKIFQTRIKSFAYPFGVNAKCHRETTWKCGYTSGMALGAQRIHFSRDQYSLLRFEVKNNLSLVEFKKFISPGSERDTKLGQ